MTRALRPDRGKSGTTARDVLRVGPGAMGGGREERRFRCLL